MIKYAIENRRTGKFVERGVPSHDSTDSINVNDDFLFWHVVDAQYQVNWMSEQSDDKFGIVTFSVMFHRVSSKPAN